MIIIELDCIVCSDCIEYMNTLPDNSIDAIVTDPPYELVFMGKKWDGSGIAYNPYVWANCLRVLKPGGHLMAFGGDRTHHRVFCAIEDAGFEIRHTIVWTFGSGFPKSLSIDKAIDKMNGAERDVIGKARYTAPSIEAAKQWAGWGSALKPAAEFICLARKSLSESTIAGNVLKWGCGGLNIDGCRIGFANQDDSRIGKGYSHNAKAGLENGTKDNSGGNEIELYKPTGRFPANLIWSHSPLCKRMGTKKVKGDGHFPKTGKVGTTDIYGNFNGADREERSLKEEEVESWDCHPSCPSWQFAKAGARGGGNHTYRRSKPDVRKGHIYGAYDQADEGTVIGKGDSGSAARFFQSCPFTEDDIPAFAYYAKAGRAERNGSTHPTMKPVALMRYLCRLICPLDGIILDPFAGSGTTCLAAKMEGFRFVGIEKEPEYCEIARCRITTDTTMIVNKQLLSNQPIIIDKSPVVIRKGVSLDDFV